MPFDLSVTISMHFYDRCQTKRDIRNFRFKGEFLLHLRSVCLWGGGVNLYFHAYVGLGYFGGFKILNFNIFGDFLKTEYFWGYEDFMDIFWGHHKIGLNNAALHLRVFSEGQGTKWRIFFWLLKFQIFIWGA